MPAYIINETHAQRTQTREIDCDRCPATLIFTNWDIRLGTVKAFGEKGYEWKGYIKCPGCGTCIIIENPFGQ